ncbi:MAG: VWA domain-containing protein [Acidobacteria bacterium]|nr:VWA domain-containing protein [Acidobacteriota bacterium]
MRFTIARGLLAGLLLLSFLFPAADVPAYAQQQQQQPKKEQKKDEPQGEFAIQVEVPLVRLDVVVTTQYGEFIPGLKKENFRVTEDGVPQQVNYFEPTDAPITMVMLMEFSRLMAGYPSYFAQGWGYEFFNRLDKRDWAALITYDMKTRVEVDFTRDKREIQDFIAHLFVPGFSEANLFDALHETLERLKDVKGKKSILVLASGYDTFSKHTLDDTLKLLRQTDVTILAVGVARQIYEYMDARRTQQGGPASVNYLQAENQLNSFAKMTGGKAWFPRFEGELPGIFSEITAMLRNQYSIGYTTNSKRTDGKFRKIKIEMVGNDGQPLSVVDQKGKKVKYIVYAREGYLPPKGGVAD